MSTFKPVEKFYEPLEQDNIRILHLEGTQFISAPGSTLQDLAVTCRLEHIRLTDPNVPELAPAPYTALSYCWGSTSPEFSKLVVCNGQVKRVTTNLYNALWQVVREGLPEKQTLWVDALCINQEDLEEKSRQVSIMGDIYRNAAMVLVWLGTGADHPGDALGKWWSWIAKEPVDGDVEGYDEVTERPGKQIFDEGRRWARNCEWFKRAWTYQELVNAGSAYVQCGPFCVAWDTFCERGSLMNFTKDIRRVRRSKGCDTINQLLRSTLYRKSIDPRDLLYSLLGVYKGKNAPPVDYSLPVSQVYRTMSLILLKELQYPFFILALGLPSIILPLKQKKFRNVRDEDYEQFAIGASDPDRSWLVDWSKITPREKRDTLIWEDWSTSLKKIVYWEFGLRKSQNQTESSDDDSEFDSDSSSDMGSDYDSDVEETKADRGFKHNGLPFSQSEYYNDAIGIKGPKFISRFLWATMGSHIVVSGAILGEFLGCRGSFSDGEWDVKEVEFHEMTICRATDLSRPCISTSRVEDAFGLNEKQEQDVVINKSLMTDDHFDASDVYDYIIRRHDRNDSSCGCNHRGAVLKRTLKKQLGVMERFVNRKVNDVIDRWNYDPSDSDEFDGEWSRLVAESAIESDEEEIEDDDTDDDKAAPMGKSRPPKGDSYFWLAFIFGSPTPVVLKTHWDTDKKRAVFSLAGKLPETHVWSRYLGQLEKAAEVTRQVNAKKARKSSDPTADPNNPADVKVLTDVHGISVLPQRNRKLEKTFQRLSWIPAKFELI